MRIIYFVFMEGPLVCSGHLEEVTGGDRHELVIFIVSIQLSAPPLHGCPLSCQGSRIFSGCEIALL